MRTTILNCLAAVLIFAAIPCGAQELSPDKMLSFADHLFDQEDYYRAITEYERFLFYYPDNQLAPRAGYQIGMSYYKGSKYEQAIRQFRTVADRYPSQETGKQALFMLGDAYYQAKDYALAANTYDSFLAQYPDHPKADAARIKKGWCYLRQGEWRQASDEFSKLPADSPLRDEGEQLALEAKQYPGIPKKSPYLAGGLSAVVPGAGQLYVGRKTDAVAAFLLNASFVWATAESYHNHSYVTAGVFLFFETGWYLGNIYNAASSAHKYNRQAEQKYMDNLQNQYGITFSKQDRTDVVAFTMRF